MKKLKYIFIILTIFIFGTIKSHAYYPCQPIQGEIWINPWWSQQVVNWVTDYRIGYIYPQRLQRVNWLDRWAQSKLLLMHQAQLFSHTAGGWTAGQVANSCGVYPAWGEILGHGQDTPAQMWQSWTYSPSHNAVMYDPQYKYIGSACAYLPAIRVFNNWSSAITCVVVFSD